MTINPTLASKSDMELILRDMADGVMVVRRNGTISYLNTRGMEILGVDESAVGQTLALLFMEEQDNDAFAQQILEAVYNKGMKQQQQVPFRNGNAQRILETSSTYLTESSELILVFTDVTEREQLIKRHHDSAVIVTTLFIMTCVAVLLYELLDFVVPGLIPPNIYTIIIEMIAALLIYIAYRLNHYSLKDIDLGFKGFVRYLPFTLLSVAGCIAAMCGAKALLIGVGIPIAPESAFLDFGRWQLSSTLYPLTVFFQEVTTRAIVQVRLKDVMDGKHKVVISILVSSLIFAAIHIAYGFPMMLCAFVLLSAFGFLYEKIGNIWLLCIIHFTLGITATLLGFM